MSFEERVLGTLIRLVRTTRLGSNEVIVPVRWWLEGDALCLVYEAPPQMGLRGLRRRMINDGWLLRPRNLANADGWAHDIALADLWANPHASLDPAAVAGGRIHWRGDRRAGLPERMTDPQNCPEPERER
ncbi:MAG: hypothetical protein ACRDPG_06290 [Nocardioidaceae bacterium]